MAQKAGKSSLSKLGVLSFLPLRSFQFIALDLATDGLRQKFRIDELNLSWVFIRRSMFLAEVLQLLHNFIAVFPIFELRSEDNECFHDLASRFVGRGNNC